MARDVFIFEDKDYSKLLPLVYTKAVYELRCGMDLLLDKIVRFYPQSKINLFCRDYLVEVLKDRSSFPVNECNWGEDGILLINGRILMNEPIPLNGEEELGIKDGTVVYARLSRRKSDSVSPSFMLGRNPLDELRKGLKVTEVDARLITHFWDLIDNNGEQIKKEFKSLAKGGIEGKVYDGVHLINESKIHIGRETKVKPGAVLDAEEGPIYIGSGVTISPNAVIEGPCFIGEGSIVRIGAKIRGGTTIGEVSRIGGEVVESIIHGYTNKQHNGFLGHSYIGEWVNLGAGTNSSNLKNNYGNIKVYVEEKFIDSGSMFMGLCMGDHSKTGIGTMFTAGTVVGVSANIFGEGIPPKFVPSFSWGGARGMVEYRFDEAMEVAKRMMSRRRKELSSSNEKLLKKIFEITQKERKAAKVK